MQHGWEAKPLHPNHMQTSIKTQYCIFSGVPNNLNMHLLSVVLLLPKFGTTSIIQLELAATDR